MKPKHFAWAGLLLLWLLAAGLGLFRPSRGAMVPVATPAVSSSRGFGSPSKLTEHYQKHGAEFDARSQDDYLRMAQALRDKPTPGDVLELKRDDGVICRFDRGSGAFIAFNADGTIRTFFKPNDGENYYRRQAKR